MPAAALSNHSLPHIVSRIDSIPFIQFLDESTNRTAHVPASHQEKRCPSSRPSKLGWISPPSSITPSLTSSALSSASSRTHVIADPQDASPLDPALPCNPPHLIYLHRLHFAKDALTPPKRLRYCAFLPSAALPFTLPPCQSSATKLPPRNPTPAFPSTCCPFASEPFFLHLSRRAAEECHIPVIYLEFLYSFLLLGIID